VGDGTGTDTNGVGKEVPKKVGDQEVPFNLARQAAVDVIKESIDEAPNNKINYTALQYFAFKDDRTGSVDSMGKPIIHVVAESGFKILKELGTKGGKYYVTVTRSAIVVGEANPGKLAEADSKPQKAEIR
jgi:hypothetical protein